MPDFRIADTFTDSLAKLTGEEQKAVKTTAFDLQLNPASPGMQFHKLDEAKDRNFWSLRVSSDIRLIVPRRLPVCSCVMSITMTRLTTGPNAASSKRIPRLERRSGWRSANGLRRLQSQNISRLRDLRRPSRCCSRIALTMIC